MSQVDFMMQMNIPKTDLMKRRKELKQSGKFYISKNGVLRPPKEFKFLPCKCQFNCGINLPEEVRRSLFEQFWDLGSWEAQSTFICSAVKEVQKIFKDSFIKSSS